MPEVPFEQWLATLELTDDKKKAALISLWQQVQSLYFNSAFEDASLCLTKSREMVEILSPLNLDKDSLCAAFLYPLLEYKQISLAAIDEQFPTNIATLCRGVAQMEAIKALQTHHGDSSKNTAADGAKIDNIRKMLLSMVEDVRAVVIKLAERVCHLRMVKNSDEEARVMVAKETSLIYAPLANRLGIGQLKWELEDISFRYLHPQTYKKIANLLDEKRLDREQYMADFVANLSKQLQALNVKGTVYGRPKHIYSIWKKMQKKSLEFDQLFDVRAVRIIVDKLQDCYTALGVVHTTWKHIPSEFDDYVATPKPNGYQSIHTVVLGPQGKPVEVQIRTEQMHQDAELGVAAHWRYKEGTASGKTTGFDEKISWLRKILQWQDDVAESGEIIDELRAEVFEDRIYVFTPKGDVIDLPMGSTPLDFAYYIHSNVGHRCIGAKISGRIVPFTYQLQTGDQVEILTSKTPNPSRDWLNPNLNYIHSARARAKVQHFFKLLDRDKYLAQGKELFEAELAKLKLTKVDIKTALDKFNMTQVDDLYVGIATGNVRLQQVINFLQLEEEKLLPAPEFEPQSVIKQSPHAGKTKVDKNGITVSGVGNLLTHIAQCCQPVPGDNILGYITQGRGISIHRIDCEQLNHLLDAQPEREVEVQWGENNKQAYQVKFQVHAMDRQGLVRDVSTIIANDRISIYGLESRSDAKNQTVTMQVTIEISNNEALNKLMNKISLIDDVIEVSRL
jgi:GTP pyrophosphokinase